MCRTACQCLNFHCRLQHLSYAINAFPERKRRPGRGADDLVWRCRSMNWSCARGAGDTTFKRWINATCIPTRRREKYISYGRRRPKVVGFNFLHKCDSGGRTYGKIRLDFPYGVNTMAGGVNPDVNILLFSWVTHTLSLYITTLLMLCTRITNVLSCKFSNDITTRQWAYTARLKSPPCGGIELDE